MSRHLFRYEDLNPKASDHFRLLSKRLEEAFASGRTKRLFKPFEGFRSLERQFEMLGKGVSKARPWQSPHQYGLAVDYVPLSDPNNPKSWVWPDENDPDWVILGQIATDCGLMRSIAWDKPHVEHPIWFNIRNHVK